ncbi:MAG: PTS sugar transporter subunit IIA [Tissierellales bacterium]|nr:PTS sugar transporter subunit IIA [Tissierellales bacterium]
MLINENLILLNSNAKNKNDLIRDLSILANNDGKINNIDEYIEAVLKREREYSTAVGFGVAIPHGKSDSVIEPFLAFARVNDIDWDSPDGKPVDIVFLIGVPEKDAGSLHLKILANLSRKLMKEDFRESLRNISSKQELLEFLNKSELGF